MTGASGRFLLWGDTMALLNVDGINLPDPQTFQMDFSDLSSAESGEDSTGYTEKDVLRIKRKLNCTWGPLSFTVASRLLQAVIKGAHLSVRYPDVLSGRYETREFYVGDRSAPYLVVNDRHKYVSGISFNFIEHGGDTP